MCAMCAMNSGQWMEIGHQGKSSADGRDSAFFAPG